MAKKKNKNRNTNELVLRAIPSKQTATKRRKRLKLNTKWEGNISKRFCKFCEKERSFVYLSNLGHSVCRKCGKRNINV